MSDYTEWKAAERSRLLELYRGDEFKADRALGQLVGDDDERGRQLFQAEKQRQVADQLQSDAAGRRAAAGDDERVAAAADWRAGQIAATARQLVREGMPAAAAEQRAEQIVDDRVAADVAAKQEQARQDLRNLMR